MTSNAVKNWALWALLPLLATLALALFPPASWADEAANNEEDTAATPAAVQVEETDSDNVAPAPAQQDADAPAVNDASIPNEAQPSGQAEQAPATPASNNAPANQEPAAPTEEPASPTQDPVTPNEGTAPVEAPAASEPEGEANLPTSQNESDLVSEATTDEQQPADSVEPAQQATPATPATPAAPQKAPRAVAAKASEAATTSTTDDDPAKHPLADGTYIFSWFKNSAYIVQSADASKKAGTNVQLGKDTAVARQRWIVKYVVEQGYYTIVNEFSKKALTAASGKSGANVFQDKVKSGNKKQLWSIVEVDGTYLIMPKANDKLAITAKVSGSGYNLVLSKAKSTKKQRFVAVDEGIVRDGIYSISLANNVKKAATLPKYSMANKAKLWWYTYKKNMNQKFNVVYAGDGQYTLQLVHSGKYLGVNGSNVVQATNGTATSQRWKVVWNKTGLALKNVATGQRLSVPNATAKNKLYLATAKSKNNASQRIAFTERRLVNNGVYIIHTFAGKRALAVEDGSLEELGNIDAETASKANSQKFRIKYVKGNYRITNVQSDMVVGYESSKAGANVRQRPNYGSDTQLFKAVVAPEGGIKFIGVHGGKTLDIAGTKDKSGANVRMAKADNSKEQRWWLERTKANKVDSIVERALRLARSQGSATNWYLAVDVKNHRTMVLKRSNGTWKLVKNWLCSVGAPSTPTVLGTYSVGIKGYSFGEGYTCYYYTQFWGDYLFHSVKYYQDTFTVKDGRLGMDVSEGCVRLPIKQAKWIYDNIPEDTRVRTYR